MIEFKYISNITESDLNESNVIACIDEEGFSCIIVKNLLNKTVLNTYNTDNLEVKLNRKLLKGENEYFVHIIKSKKMDYYSKHQFEIIYEYIFKKFTNPISDIQLAQLITSLEDYFKTTPEKDRTRFQIGVFGELFTLKYLYENGYHEIIEKYHRNFYSKHDIEIDEKNRLEIKTIAGDRRIHTFKHNQICRDDINVYIASVILELSKEGTSLYDLFDFIETKSTDPDLNFELEKLKIRAGVSEDDRGIRCSEQLAKNNIRFMRAEDTPHLDKYSAKVDGISNIQYDVDCELSKFTETGKLIEIFKNL